MHGFTFFNQIFLRLFDVSNVFHDSTWVVYIIWHIFISILVRNYHKTYLKYQINLIKFS